MKFGKSLYILILFFIIIFFYACPDEWQHYSRFNNESTDTLGVYLALGYFSSYPDTILPNSYKTFIIGVNPNSVSGLALPAGNELYKNIFKKRLSKDTLSVFVFNADTLFTYNWDIIREEYKILARYDFSYNDLERLDFIIPYPPTEAMKDMKMYPPYGTK